MEKRTHTLLKANARSRNAKGTDAPSNAHANNSTQSRPLPTISLVNGREGEWAKSVFANRAMEPNGPIASADISGTSRCGSEWPET
jgi:hypothetical protein